MKSILLISGLFVSFLLTGCSRKVSLITTEAEFDAVMGNVFDPSKFDIVGSGLSGGGDEIEYSVFLQPKSPDDPLSFDFSSWERFLHGKDSFTDKGSGGSDGLYWRQTWGNNQRYVVIDAVLMKNSNVKATYREILR
jgi:hypothetical protein